MHFSATAIFTTLLAGTAFAAPAPAVKSMATSTTWTIENMKRQCDRADTNCHWSFTVNNNAGGRTDCAYVVIKPNGGNVPASRLPQTGANCGAYTVTSGWSGQFGENNGFTTLSVVENSKRQIAWPAYTDNQLKTGNVVKPDQSYPVQALP